MLNISTSSVNRNLWEYFESHYFEDYNDGPNQYVTEVLSLANAEGIGPKWAATKLFKDHGSSESEYLEEGNQQYNLLQILEFLGYWF